MYTSCIMFLMSRKTELFCRIMFWWWPECCVPHLDIQRRRLSGLPERKGSWAIALVCCICQFSQMFTNHAFEQQFQINVGEAQCHKAISENTCNDILKWKVRYSFLQHKHGHVRIKCKYVPMILMAGNLQAMHSSVHHWVNLSSCLKLKWKPVMEDTSRSGISGQEQLFLPFTLSQALPLEMTNSKCVSLCVAKIICILMGATNKGINGKPPQFRLQQNARWETSLLHFSCQRKAYTMGCPLHASIAPILLSLSRTRYSFWTAFTRHCQPHHWGSPVEQQVLSPVTSELSSFRVFCQYRLSKRQTFSFTWTEGGKKYFQICITKMRQRWKIKF